MMGFASLNPSYRGLPSTRCRPLSENASLRPVRSLGFRCKCPLQVMEITMRDRLTSSMITVASVAAVIGVVVSAFIAPAAAQAPASAAAPSPPLITPWGEPDLQGIWTDETDTPLQRSPKFADQEFFTDAQRADLDRQ